MKDLEVRMWPSKRFPDGWDYQCLTTDDSYRGGGVRESSVKAAQDAIRAALRAENIDPKFVVDAQLYTDE